MTDNKRENSRLMVYIIRMVRMLFCCVKRSLLRKLSNTFSQIRTMKIYIFTSITVFFLQFSAKTIGQRNEMPRISCIGPSR